MTSNQPQFLFISADVPTPPEEELSLFFPSPPASQGRRTWAEKKAIKLMQYGCHKVVDISRAEQFTTWKKEVRACIKPWALSQIYYAFSCVICDIISGMCQ